MKNKMKNKMKHKFCGGILTEFLGLKSKICSMKKIDGKGYNTVKGVSIVTEFDKFRYVLFNEEIIRYKMKRIQSKKHKFGNYEIDKMSLSCFDDKQYALDSVIYTLACFYKNSVTRCKGIKKD